MSDELSVRELALFRRLSVCQSVCTENADRAFCSLDNIADCPVQSNRLQCVARVCSNGVRSVRL